MECVSEPNFRYLLVQSAGASPKLMAFYKGAVGLPRVFCRLGMWLVPLLFARNIFLPGGSNCTEQFY